MRKFLSILIFFGFYGVVFAATSFQLGDLSWVHEYGTNAAEKTISIPSGYTIVSDDPMRGNEGAQAYFTYSAAESAIYVTPSGSKPIGTYKGRLNVTLRDSEDNLYPNCWILLTEKVSTQTRFFDSFGYDFQYVLTGSSFKDIQDNAYYGADSCIMKDAYIIASEWAAPNGYSRNPFGVSATCGGIETWVYASFGGGIPGNIVKISHGTPFFVSGEAFRRIITIPAVDLSSFAFDDTWGWYRVLGGAYRKVELRVSSFTNITTYSLDADSQTWGSHDFPDQPNPNDPNPAPDQANTEEPINFITGNNHFSGLGLIVPTPGIPLSFDLTYNSTETNGAPVGTGWHHSYDWSLAVESNTASVTSGDTRIYTFLAEGAGTYSASFENGWQLTGQTNGWHVLTLPGDIAYRFDTNGILQQISDGWSNSVSLVYSNGLLASAEHSNGQSLEFAYSNGLLSSVSAATNLSVSFTYDTNGVLVNAIRQTDSGQYPETYQYNALLLLTQRVDSVGSDYHYTYDTGTGKATGMYLTDDRWYEHAVEYSNELSRVIYTRGGEELVHDYDYDPVMKRVLEERLDSVTGKVTYAYRSGGNVERKTTYDANTNHWMQVYRLYDDRHNITNEAFGLSATPTNITQYTWHPEWQTLTSISDPANFKTEYEYTNGAIALSRIWLSSNQTAETTYSYTTNGLLSAITNANGHSVSFTYDTRGYPESVIPQAGPVMTFGYDSLGHLTNSALPGGRETAYTVNPLGWVERIETADNLHETFQYNGLGDVTHHVDRAERTTAYEYFPGGKLKAVSRQLGSTNVTVSYDFDQQFNTLSIRDELNRPVESYGLDPQDRPTTVTNLEEQTMSIRYLVGDFVDSITRFDSTVVSNEYTGDGFLKAVHYPDETNRYTYLRNGLVQTLENSGGMISNGWNQASWLTQTVSSASSVTSVVNYAYDLVGNVTNSSVNLQSAIINRQYTYDEAERLTVLLAETQSTQTFAYAYNPNNGLVASVSNENLRAEYEYDLMDRAVNIELKNSWGTTLRNVAYSYSDAGMITQKIMTAGFEISTNVYGYDDLDRLIYADGVEYGYDAAGNRQTKTGGDFAVGYNPGTGNRLASWDASSTNGFESFRTLEVRGSSSEPIGTDNRWGQLWVSNMVAVVPDINGTNFSIDAFAVGLGTQTVVAAIRDQAGNVGYATNEFFLSVVTNAQYQYSAAGCLTNVSYSGTEYSDTKALEWNAQYQLTSVSSACSVVEYSYDVLGRRISCTVAGGDNPGTTNTENYVYDGNQVVADLDKNGNLLRSYVWGPGIDNLLCFTDHITSNTYYALKDHLNSVLALADESGNVVESYEYDAWGKVLSIKDSSGNVLSQSAIGNRYLWQGREYDFTTSLYYFRARWYDPVAGRFISKDPIGISGGLNQYVAFNNSPLNFTDPDGLKGLFSGPFGEWSRGKGGQILKETLNLFGEAGPINGSVSGNNPSGVLDIMKTKGKPLPPGSGALSAAGLAAFFNALLAPGTADAAEINIPGKIFVDGQWVDVSNLLMLEEPSSTCGGLQ